MSEEVVVYEAKSDAIDLVPTMVMTTAQAMGRLKEFQEFVDKVMVKGVDYGEIPGVSKPCLFKPGAEKLTEIYGLASHIEVTTRIEDWEKGFFHYEVKCRLESKRSGNIVAEGIGSCNSREKRYADRWVFGNDIPDGVDKATLKSKEITSKKNNQKYTMYLWTNDDPYTLVNTLLKMAKKRALVDAVLSATRSSGMFTQDVEDMVTEKPATKTATVAPSGVPSSTGNATYPAEAQVTFTEIDPQENDWMANLAMATKAELTAWYSEQGKRVIGTSIRILPATPEQKATLEGFRDAVYHRECALRGIEG